ncbi:MAG: nucleotidyltransferase domain-containing protein [Candidatus Nanohaloarchaea archaeon]
MVVEMEVVEEFAEKVSEALDGRVEEVKLFGSYARGEELPGSDIDVLVVLEERREGDQALILDTASDYFWSHDVFFSPKVISSDELEKKQDFGFFKGIEEEGVTVYG